MVNKDKDFESNGLKIDQERVLTFSKMRCPLDCSYCFTEDLNIESNEDGTYLSEGQLMLLRKLPDNIKSIMLGCDTEFFIDKQKSIEIIENLLESKKDISIVTKLFLPPDFVARLSAINKQMKIGGNFLAISVSLPCLNSARKWEPKAPKPKSRIDTLKILHDHDINTMVAIRPLLPDVPNEEIEQIISLTKDFCFGYYSGPLYLKHLDSALLGHDFSNLSIEMINPHWMPGGNIFYKIERRGQMDDFKKILAKHDLRVFDGAAEGLEYIRHEKH